MDEVSTKPEYYKYLNYKTLTLSALTWAKL